MQSDAAARRQDRADFDSWMWLDTLPDLSVAARLMRKRWAVIPRGNMQSPASMIVIGGFAGSGKSTLAKKLGNVFSIPVFEIDHLARSIKDSSDFHGESREAYGIAFDIFFAFAYSHLDNGSSLILDQNMGHAVTWDNLRRLRDSLRNVDFKIFLLECPYELCVTRFLSRTEHPNLHEVTVENLANHKYKWDYLHENELPDAIRIDATREPQVVFDEVFGYVKG